MGAPVGETEWHRNDMGVQQNHYMRDGSTASNFGSMLLSHTNRQPLSQENAAAMQHQDDTLLAAKLEQAQLSKEYGGAQKNADLGRTDSKRGLRGAMAPMHTGTSAAGERARPFSTTAPLVQTCCKLWRPCRCLHQHGMHFALCMEASMRIALQSHVLGVANSVCILMYTKGLNTGVMR